jgi:polyketide biosynthesis enoyl-CoA hydratase PksI
MEPVVTISRPSPGVAVVEMADRASRNTFSKALIRDLIAAFEALRGDDGVHAIVAHGYDSYFCVGGTQEELLDFADRRVQFDYLPLFRLFLDAEVPVIAAMQGHAIGGGLAMGLFADVVILSEESLYSANFMKYGFTPGMGATLVLPAKLGPALAGEMLLTAGNYHGGELARRGIPFPVLKRRDVIPAALRMARDIADKPLASVKLLKRRLNAELVERLPAAVRAEVDMHEVSFAQPEVRRRIETLFGN